MNIQTIDQYIAQYPEDIQERMNALRSTIRKVAPEATEKISWGMATFILKKNLVHFAGQKNHIGFYPGVSGVEKFKDKLPGYKTSKGAIQFPNNKPLPLDIVRQIVEYRVKENNGEIITEKQ